MKPSLAVPTRRHVQAFTVWDLVIVLVTVALLVVFMLSMGSRAQQRPARINCISQLRAVGLSFRMWSNDHNDKFPWMVSTTGDGTMELATSREVFRHFQAISNEVTTPKVLVCPDDRALKRVSAWTNLNNANLSYFVGVDADETKRQTILLGDRNVTGGVQTSGSSIALLTPNNAGWGSDIHRRAGNIGLADGSAMQATDRDLRRQLQWDQTNRNATVTRLAVP